MKMAWKLHGDECQTLSMFAIQPFMMASKS